MTDKQLDTYFTRIVYATTGICFAGAILFILYACYGVIQGQAGVTSTIYNAGLLVAIGIAISGFLFWMRSWAGR